MENNKPFKLATEQIPAINGGWLDTELGEAMSEAVRTVLSMGKQAEVTLKLKIQPQNIGEGTVKISHDVTSKLPKEKREGGIVFATPEGNITPNNPRQNAFDLKVAVGSDGNKDKTLKIVKAA